MIQIGKYLSWIGVIFPPVLWIIFRSSDSLGMQIGVFSLYTWIYFIAWYSVTFVMIIRPLADIFPRYTLLRKLCILRRGFGIISAMILTTLLLDKWISSPSTFLSVFSWSDWVGVDAFSARISEITAIILLITSNNLSQRILKKHWKTVQKSSYLYFVFGGIVALKDGDTYGIFASMIVWGILFIIAYIYTNTPRRGEIS